MSKTTLWYVGLFPIGSNTILVSKTDRHQQHQKRIRTISGNAAGRKYKKEILPSIIIGIDHEWYSLEDPPETPKAIKEFKHTVKSRRFNTTYKIVVDKS